LAKREIADMAKPIRRKSMVLIISGPSGTGKGTLIQRLMASDPSICFACSATTRASRGDEVDGQHYYFMSDDKFDSLLRADAFLEHAVVHGNRYGTLHSEVDKARRDNRIVLLDIDPKGAINVMNAIEDHVSVFILPPSYKALRVRLHTRNTDDPVEIERRLINACDELKTVSCYQYAVINDDLDLAFIQLQSIVNAEKQRTSRFLPIIQED